MIFKLHIVILLFLLSMASSCGPSQEEHDNLKSELDKIKLELKDTKSELEELKIDLEHCNLNVKELKDTATERLARARTLQKENKQPEAEKEFYQLIEKYPDSPEAQSAKDAISKIEQKKEEEKIAREKEEEEKERKKRLGFKVLKAQNPIKIGPLSLKFNSIKTQKKWIFDRYNSYYRYRDSKRGNKFIVADISITSESNYPQLPPIQIYKVSNSSLSYIGTLHYDFYKWEDYGSYLGNDADYGNDFAHTKKIRFVAGLEISEDELNNDTLVVLVNDQMCFKREQDRFGRPAIKYNGGSCNYKWEINLEEAEENYSVAKMYNKDKL